MPHLIGLVLATVRRERRVPQGALARGLGVSQQTVSRWERGERPFPDKHLQATCTLLGVPPQRLVRATGAVALKVLHGTRRSRRPRYRPLYAIGARLEHVSSLGRFEHALQDRVRSRLSPLEYDEIAERFPRDTRFELAFVLQVLDHGAEVVQTSPGRFRFALHVLHDSTWADGKDLLQPALLWSGRDERAVIFGQPWINLPWDCPVRPDFLVYYKRKGEPGYWLWVEVDDGSHRDKGRRDQEKALAINLPGLRYEDSAIVRQGFFERFLRDVRGLGGEVRRRRSERRRRARRLEGERRAAAEAKLSRS